jgi:carbonic anhydrase
MAAQLRVYRPNNNPFQENNSREHSTMSNKNRSIEADRNLIRRNLIQLMRGAGDFSRNVFPMRADLFSSLAQGQSPGTLFITCADSRIVPEMITQSQPGELFVCRNIGNIVPGYGEMLGGVSAVIEYAVMALGVSQIVICGHTDCGAMKGLMLSAGSADEMPTVVAWLRNAQAAKSVVMTRKLPQQEIIQALVEENVRLQLMHLRSHPAVAARLAQRRLEVQGWVYDIGHGKVSVLDEGTGKFESLTSACERLGVASR